MSDQAIGAVEALLALAAVASVSWAGMRVTLPLLADRAPTAVNYRGVSTSVGLGLVWVWWNIGVAFSGALSTVFRDIYLRLGNVPGGSPGAWAGQGAVSLAASAVGGATIVMVLGLMDDYLGSGDVRGLRGHLRAWRERTVTTGMVKLVGIGSYALLVAMTAIPVPFRTAGPGYWTIDRIGFALAAGALIAGTSNLLNLFDTRPGRSLKVYGLLVFLVAAASLASPSVYFAAADGLAQRATSAVTLAAFAAVPMLAVWRADLRERAMLGDGGSNALGFTAGFLMAATLPWWGVVAAAVVVVGLNLASERISFSEVIDGTPFLSWADGVGRLAVGDTDQSARQTSAYAAGGTASARAGTGAGAGAADEGPDIPDER